MTGYIHVPQSWNGYLVNGRKLTGSGYATYRLIINVKDEAAPPEAGAGSESGSALYGLKILPMGTSYRLWINGELVAQNGMVGTEGQKASAQYLAQEVFFTSLQPEIELVLQISNFQHQKGGFWYSPQLRFCPAGREKPAYQVSVRCFPDRSAVHFQHLSFRFVPPEEERPLYALFRTVLPCCMYQEPYVQRIYHYQDIQWA